MARVSVAVFRYDQVEAVVGPRPFGNVVDPFKIHEDQLREAAPTGTAKGYAKKAKKATKDPTGSHEE